MRLLAQTTFDRANATEQQSARVQRRALKYVMDKAKATYPRGSKTEETMWTRSQIHTFMSEHRDMLEHKTHEPSVLRLLELLRNQVEYLELCIDVHKLGEGNIPSPPKVVGHIDLDKA